MITVIIIIVLVYCFICLIIGIVQYIKSPKPPDGLTMKEYQQYYYNKEWQLDNNEDEIDDIHQNERIMLLDETIVKYNKLLDNLHEQYKSTYSETEKAKLLAKQVSTMERLNRALEKREKLE